MYDYGDDGWPAERFLRPWSGDGVAAVGDVGGGPSWTAAQIGRWRAYNLWQPPLPVQ